MGRVDSFPQTSEMNSVWDLLHSIQPGGSGGGAWIWKKTVHHLGKGLNW